MTKYTISERTFTLDIKPEGAELDTDITETWHARPRVVTVGEQPGSKGWVGGSYGTWDKAPQWARDLVSEVLA